MKNKLLLKWILLVFVVSGIIIFTPYLFGYRLSSEQPEYYHSNIQRTKQDSIRTERLTKEIQNWTMYRLLFRK